MKLTDIEDCLMGAVPLTIVSVSKKGKPNTSIINQMHYVDENHVALSRQFFNKTIKNLEETGMLCAVVMDPQNYHSYRVQMKYLRSETKGPTFNKLNDSIQTIASMTGLEKVLKLLSADICEVLSVDPVGDDIPDV